jgi:outer membrane protein
VLLNSENENRLLIKGHLQTEKEIPDENKLLDMALNKNLEMIETQNNINVSTLELKQLNGQAFPQMDLEAKYGKFLTEDAVFYENNNYSVFLKLSIPIFSGFEYVNGKRSLQSQKDSQLLKLEYKKNSLRQQIKNAVDEFRTILERLDIEEKNIIKSEKYYRLTYDEYKRGVKNSPDMVGATERKVNTQIRNLEYRRDLYLAKLKIMELVSVDPLQNPQFK